ncbi:MAG: alpha/beta hydrolase family protein, partial [Candidatus Binatia bacterium]
PLLSQDQTWQWQVQALAEHGYVVMYADLSRMPGDDTADATDWLLSTPSDPTPHAEGEFNPWWERLDRTRLGMAGTIGGPGAPSQTLAHADERFDAVVSNDGPTASAVEAGPPRIPQLAFVRDFVVRELEGLVEPPPPAKPEPNRGGDQIFDVLRAARIDAMQVTLRSMTHSDSTGTVCTHPGTITLQPPGCTLHTEPVMTYYMLAWFDRYLKGSTDALDRLTRSGTDTFDGYADVYAISTGRFDPVRAAEEADIEAGNVPITVGGQSIRNRLSFWFPSRYVFHDENGDEVSYCGDMRAGCPD